ncbi:hypothetical protein [Marinitenerispora sediminis]|uniref:Uncharacterized protein n=1 Tax=Marinitenerispora sediminis TaxID=1931232 RepID=A0A368T8U3_9ACTN|nr:hypothetical protein [Marinitenerispora sediminis]RCV54309.1 hypothetical protein DEF28_08485 [Marinitenerispora sediminis]RCV60518.1 hypothetical protein DEF24_06980 [Marinitenerispora sediminis]RCV61070.1 hypothetical protein DEF23_03410 [Marinitenerispora sediminis]
MSNTVRHVIGALVGIAMVPVTVFALGWGQWNLQLAMTRFDYTGGFLGGMAVLLAVGCTLGLLAGSRVSPLTSLLPGLALAFLGVYGSLPAGYSFFNQLIPFDFWWNGVTVYPLLGVLLVAASTPVSRWRSGRRSPKRAGRRAAAPEDRPAAAPVPGSPGPLPDSWVPPVRARTEHAAWPPPAVQVQPGGPVRPVYPGQPNGPGGFAATGPQPAGRPGAPDAAPPPGDAPGWAGSPAARPRPEQDVPHLYGTGPMPPVPPTGPAPGHGTNEPHLYGTGPLPRIPEAPPEPPYGRRPPAEG